MFSRNCPLRCIVGIIIILESTSMSSGSVILHIMLHLYEHFQCLYNYIRTHLILQLGIVIYLLHFSLLGVFLVFTYALAKDVLL